MTQTNPATPLQHWRQPLRDVCADHNGATEQPARRPPKGRRAAGSGLRPASSVKSRGHAAQTSEHRGKGHCCRPRRAPARAQARARPAGVVAWLGRLGVAVSPRVRGEAWRPVSHSPFRPVSHSPVSHPERRPVSHPFGARARATAAASVRQTAGALAPGCSRARLGAPTSPEWRCGRFCVRLATLGAARLPAAFPERHDDGEDTAGARGERTAAAPHVEIAVRRLPGLAVLAELVAGQREHGRNRARECERVGRQGVEHGALAGGGR